MTPQIQYLPGELQYQCLCSTPNLLDAGKMGIESGVNSWKGSNLMGIGVLKLRVGRTSSV